MAKEWFTETEKVLALESRSVQEAEPKEIWDMMFRLLTPGQRKQVTGLFGTKGIDAVFPFLFDEKSSLP